MCTAARGLAKHRRFVLARADARSGAVGEVVRAWREGAMSSLANGAAAGLAGRADLDQRHAISQADLVAEGGRDALAGRDDPRQIQRVARRQAHDVTRAGLTVVGGAA